MPAPHVDRRPDALQWAEQHGWEHQSAAFDDGQIVRDVFTKGDLQLRAVWLTTPFSDAMWARGLLLRPKRPPLTVPRVTSAGPRASVEGILSGTPQRGLTVSGTDSGRTDASALSQPSTGTPAAEGLTGRGR